jgi:phosphatidylglycerophosphate synthase
MVQAAPPFAMTAIVFVSGLAADERFRVGGLGLLQRALIVAERAGVRRCLVAGRRARLASDPRFPRLTPVADLADARAVLRSEGATPETRVLCLHAAVITHPAALARFLATTGEAAVVALHAVPVALVAAGALEAVWPAFAEGRELSAEQWPGHIEHRHLSQGLFAWVQRADQAPDVERRLLLSGNNPRDGRTDTLFNRRLSRPLSRRLLRLPLTASHVTWLSLVAAALGALSFARGTYLSALLGAVLFQLAAVLDCCDGEVARVKLQESPLGDLLDIALDAAGNVLLFLGMARGAWVAGALPDAAAVGGALAAGILASFPLVTYVERSLPEPALSPEHRLAKRLVAALSSRDFSVLVFAAALTATTSWLLRGAAIGANVFWVLLLVLLLRGRRRGKEPQMNTDQPSAGAARSPMR